jgi:hypothetical protein
MHTLEERKKKETSVGVGQVTGDLLSTVQDVAVRLNLGRDCAQEGAVSRILNSGVNTAVDVNGKRGEIKSRSIVIVHRLVLD